MPNESGDLKLLANFRKLIDLVSADSDYKPSNAALKPPALNAQHTTGLSGANEVPAKFATNMAAITDREVGFAEVNPTAVPTDQRAGVQAKIKAPQATYLNQVITFRG